MEKLGKYSRGKQTHYPKDDFQLFYLGNVPFIETQDCKKGKIFAIKIRKFYNSLGVKQGKVFPKNSVCIASEGNFVSETCLIKNSSCLSCHIHGFISDKKISDPKFIKYCFDFAPIKNKILALSGATTRLSLTTDKLSQISFPKPSLEIQQKIGEILSRYDLILDNYERQIELLKNLKVSLFKEWFIKLRFPDYESYSIRGGSYLKAGRESK